MTVGSNSMIEDIAKYNEIIRKKLKSIKKYLILVAYFSTILTESHLSLTLPGLGLLPCNSVKQTIHESKWLNSNIYQLKSDSDDK